MGPRHQADRGLDQLLDLAKLVRDPATALGREVRAGLSETSALSEEGIELALREHLETEVMEDDRASLRGWCVEAPRCHVVLSAHVCTAALRAIALAIASSPEVVLKPSRRDPVLATVFARELGLTITDRLSASPGDQVHAYGSDRAIADIARILPKGTLLRGHGSGFGVAIVESDADLDHAAEGLAADVVAFDQRGCLSPRVAFVVGSEALAEDFAHRLHAASSAAALAVPRGSLQPDERRELASFRRTALALGDVLEDRDHLVAFLRSADGAVPIGPATRSIVVASVSNQDEVAPLLGAFSRFVTTCGHAGAATDALRAFQGARICPLGSMQKPRLDGPVDRRAYPELQGPTAGR